MKLNRNTIVIPLVALMLVGAAGAVLATTGNPTAPDVQAPAAATPTPAPSSGTTTKPAFEDDILTGVLDDLVAKGTITTAQKTAILDGLTAERTARQEARKAAMDKAKADRQQIRDFLVRWRDHQGGVRAAPGRQPAAPAHHPDGRRPDHHR